MTNKTPLEDAFNLPSLKDIEQEMTDDLETEFPEDADFADSGEMTAEEYQRSIANLKAQLSDAKEASMTTMMVNDSAERYQEKMNEIHAVAMEKFAELFDGILSMEVTAGAKFLAGAAKMLDIAKDAQNSSMDRIINLAKLQMANEKHNKEIKGLITPPKTIATIGGESDDGDIDETPKNIVLVEDRNSILARLKDKH